MTFSSSSLNRKITRAKAKKPLIRYFLSHYYEKQENWTRNSSCKDIPNPIFRSLATMAQISRQLTMLETVDNQLKEVRNPKLWSLSSESRYCIYQFCRRIKNWILIYFTVRFRSGALTPLRRKVDPKLVRALPGDFGISKDKKQSGRGLRHDDFLATSQMYGLISEIIKPCEATFRGLIQSRTCQLIINFSWNGAGCTWLWATAF